MSVDQRDWHREWWKKRSGYVERAAFRLPESRRQRAGMHWSLKLVLSLALLVLLLAMRHFLW